MILDSKLSLGRAGVLHKVLLERQEGVGLAQGVWGYSAMSRAPCFAQQTKGCTAIDASMLTAPQQQPGILTIAEATVFIGGGQEPTVSEESHAKLLTHSLHGNGGTQAVVHRCSTAPRGDDDLYPGETSKGHTSRPRTAMGHIPFSSSMSCIMHSNRQVTKITSPCSPRSHYPSTLKISHPRATRERIKTPHTEAPHPTCHKREARNPGTHTPPVGRQTYAQLTPSSTRDGQPAG